MARMPGAVWKPMVASSTTPMSRYDVLCVHTCVGSLAGTDSWFRQKQDGTNSHFGVGGDGTIWQWVDTAYRSGASYNGNYHLISVECADMGAPFGPWAGSDVPAWTAEQIDALGRIAAWVNTTHGIPLTQIPDALPSRRGVGYHRLGVPGYMVAGAEQWSTKAYKACPGDRRIAQVPQVIAAALGDDMPLSQDDLNKISVVVKEWAAKSLASTPLIDWGGGKTATLPQQAADNAKAIAAVQGQVAGLLEALKGAGTAGGVDLEAVRAASEQGTLDGLAKVRLTVDDGTQA